MLTLPQLKLLAKQNNICYSNKNKNELIKLLIDNKIITSSDLVPKITVNTVKRNYGHLKVYKLIPKQLKFLIKKQVKLLFFLQNVKQGVRLE